MDRDRKINFRKPGHPIHGWFTNTCPSDEALGPFVTNRAHVELDPEGPFANNLVVDMPFHANHTQNVKVDWQPEPACMTSYLALASTKDYHQTVDGAQPDTYVVRALSQGPRENCDHVVHHDAGRRAGPWKAVAYLAGWRQGKSSLGTVVAISPEGTKIAAATWNRVTFYSLSPKLLHQGELQHYFPARDYNKKKGFGRLRPTPLPSEGVVHNMVWADETKLYATTDRGLIEWDLGPTCHGGREVLSLTYDAWPENVLALPGVGTRWHYSDEMDID